MPASLVKVNGTEVSVEGPDKTVVNINISQESSLSYLVKAMAAAGRNMARQKKPASETPEPSAPARVQCTGEQKVLGAAQILLGLMCLGLGAVLCLFYDYLRAIGSGAPFWMGSLFVVSGILSVLSERRGGGWVFLATFFNLASVVAGCVALSAGVADVDYPPSYWMCDEDEYRAWEGTQRPGDDWRLERCKNFLTVVHGVQILLLIFCVAALGIALFCFGFGLRLLCCRLRANSQDYVAVGDPEVPPPYEEPSQEKTSA
ncbi:transmembrane protein 176A [Eublepharis macularius]|uniref:Transmembrane protein 176A n=1 Tax=Eublepharis macularius TaxID=481883 RepID=A0AA97LC99_EUBMA|nr:transmembrane protein 176A [Eublepharis macularius]XP_054847200.1 transmembrane protein 176A [Eublepharis macularius]XP_054847201.1 transmembrane protein 176A [Eublepharis macularius]XP_054847202.1 transmembrane protein 176A [Eublepharis macularius]XP_054847203.1 transmembrane protein 176A [Eublepharis macularius]